MRIIRGTLKGMRFKKMKSFSSRPTTDFAKEGLFNILENTLHLEGITVLDLFAGLGSISFEFISRGAKSLSSVDFNHQSCKYIRANSKIYNLEGKHKIIQMDAMHYIQKDVGSFDLIFADPPYNFDKYDDLIEGIKSKNILNNNGDLIVEHGKQTNLEHIVGFQKTKTFGHVYFSFFNFDSDED